METVSQHPGGEEGPGREALEGSGRSLVSSLLSSAFLQPPGTWFLLSEAALSTLSSGSW